MIFPACLADRTQKLPIPSAVTQLIKYEQYQLGACVQSELCNAAQGASLVEQEGLYVTCP